MASPRVPVAVVGASGYAGAELCRLLLGHPRAELAAVCGQRRAGEPLASVVPSLAGITGLVLEAFDARALAERVEVALIALPHGDSAPVAAQLLERGVAVLDLSADFRLHDAAVHAAWYSDLPEEAALHRAEAVYGLPERHRPDLAGARLIAVPGCYPTATLLAAAPLLAAGLIAPDVIVDAKSGVSGGGRSPSLATHFCEIGEGIRAYKVAGSHRHTPEMEQELSVAAGAEVAVTFTPHLVPMARGILACVYARATAAASDEATLRQALVAAYAGEPFVTVLAPGKLPDTAHVRGTNRAHVQVAHDSRTGRVIAMAAIDNLGKGAAGQAIQCLNIARGWQETCGLGHIAAFP
ncbi:MAG TPA: N-acetyl-gamma-glutamyl-phosphate reductase [Kofleriaceae bacterium]|nr:N-acetyl-gamma-glutamyl-phosphate reductase [Kofleriaceae bacterium]